MQDVFLPPGSQDLPPPRDGYRHISDLGIAEVLIATVVLHALAAAAAVVATFIEPGLVVERNLDDLANAPTTLVILYGVLFFEALVGMASRILWWTWSFRAARTMRTLFPGRPQTRPGWLIYWWWIPIANLWMPLSVMQELWRATDPDRGITWRESDMSWTLVGWWLLLVLGPVAINLVTVGLIMSGSSGGLVDTSDITGTVAAAASAIYGVYAVAALLEALVVNDLTQRVRLWLERARAPQRPIHTRNDLVTEERPFERY